MKRVLLLMVLTIIFIFVEMVNWFCFLLDEITYPNWRKTSIRKPLFIVGMPRTASTWLHKTLFSDSGQFTSMKSWEILFAPSIIQKKACNLLGKFDRRFNGILSNPIKKIDNFLFRNYKPGHPTSFFDIEEDDIVLIHILSNMFLIFQFPGSKRLRNLAWFDVRLPEKRKKRIMWFFRVCIQKHLYVYGNGRTYLSKSPCHTPKIQSLKATFPDSRFVCTFRHPEQAIPSALSLFFRYFKIFENHLEIKNVAEQTLQMADHWYAYPLKIFSDWLSEDYLLLDYNHLVHSPETTVSEIYHHFGLTLSDEFRQKLVAENQKSKTYKSNHIYSVSEFGITEEEIQERYLQLYEQYLKSSDESNRKKESVPVSMVENGQSGRLDRGNRYL